MSSTKRGKSEVVRLREFGLIMSLAFTLLTGVLAWKQSQWILLTSLLSACFLLAGLFTPSLLAPIEKRWLQFGEFMSVIISWIIVTLTFYLVIAPLGTCMRLFGADLLKTKLDREAKSYWVACEADGPASRPFTPY